MKTNDSVEEAVEEAVEESVEESVEERARFANRPESWNKLWEHEGEESWRKTALARVYDRIIHLVPNKARIVDLGGGLGILADRLRVERGDLWMQERGAERGDQDHATATVHGVSVEVWDSSTYAVQHRNAQFAADRPTAAHVVDLEALKDGVKPPAGWQSSTFVSTETLEHLSEAARQKIFEMAKSTGKDAYFSVPNDRLGPDEEPQHTIKYTALSFLQTLRAHWGKACRVEVLGPYLLGVCGPAAEKSFSLAMTMPVRDEAAGIEAVLASFRGCCDEIVIGVDPRTVDRTFEIAEKYAEKVFYLTELDGPEGDKVSDAVPEDKRIHFAHARNQCIGKCSTDWIFMTEGHERLYEGHDALLHLHNVPSDAETVMVLRTGQGQQWGFPWLQRNLPHLRYTRSTHNLPPDAPCVNAPQIKTLHDRVHVRSLERSVQRKAQNRVTLLDDWLHNANTGSLFYLGSEYREDDPAKAIEFLFEYLRQNTRNGPMRYHCRLVLAKTLVAEGRSDEAKEVLYAAGLDDFSRIEHWMFLGDLAFGAKHFHEAETYYRYMATRIGEPPFTVWWIDLSCYGYLAAQRLAACYGELGMTSKALRWAQEVLRHLPADAPGVEEAIEEAKANVLMLEESIHGD